MSITLRNWPWAPDPDYHRLVQTLRGRGDPHHVSFLEISADLEIIASILGESLIQPEGIMVDRKTKQDSLRQRIGFWYQLGYDAIWQGAEVDLPGILGLQAEDTAILSRQIRFWANEKAGIVSNWEEFDRYPWPTAKDVDYSSMEYLIQHLPDGMGIIASTIGMLEPLMYLMGFETFAYALYDDRALIRAICTKISELFLPIAQTLVEMDRVIALGMADDMGFKTGILIARQDLHEFIFPYQKSVALIAHTYDLPFLLHSCGKLDTIMDDLIDDVQIDAKHAFEDVIEPVESFVARYGDRVSTLGGVDMDLLARGTEDQVRIRTRDILEKCCSSGGYALGSGNSIANYIPVKNFLAMLDEGWKYNTGAYH